MQNTFTLSRNARRISPNELLKMCASKNACRTAGQPDELTTSATAAPKKTIVLATAIATPRAP
jgi:hypothetical protein